MQAAGRARPRYASMPVCKAARSAGSGGQKSWPADACCALLRCPARETRQQGLAWLAVSSDKVSDSPAPQQVRCARGTQPPLDAGWRQPPGGGPGHAQAPPVWKTQQEGAAAPPPKRRLPSVPKVSCPDPAAAHFGLPPSRSVPLAQSLGTPPGVPGAGLAEPAGRRRRQHERRRFSAQAPALLAVQAARPRRPCPSLE